MVDRFIYSFYKNSLVNSIDYVSLTKDEKKDEKKSKYFYTIIIDNIPVTSTVTSLLSDESEGFTYKKISLKTSQSLDGECTKTNGVIKSVKKIFTTDEKLVLQKHISLFGYMSEEKDVKKRIFKSSKLG